MTQRHRNIGTGRSQRPQSASGRGIAGHLPRRVRWLAFGAIALVLGVVAVSLIASRLLPASPTDMSAVQVRASMGGFEPASLEVKAGQVVRVEFSSTDTSFHSDGGGWHEFAIDALGIDQKVGPESSRVFEFTAPTKPGSYAWYCNICCGGKENPSMQGRLTVTA